MKPDNTKQPGPPKGNETVLLVEDERFVRAYMAMVLRELGYKVLEAVDFGTALRILVHPHGQNIDLLLTDIVMPNMDGKELAYETGSISPKTKVLFCSAYPQKLDARKGMIDERIPFLQKPVTLNALAFKVREVLDRPKTDFQMALSHPTEEQIRARAYQIHLDHSGQPGQEESDWRQAEYELMQLAQRRYSEPQAATCISSAFERHRRCP